jgi:hypothetical protein
MEVERLEYPPSKIAFFASSSGATFSACSSTRSPITPFACHQVSGVGPRHTRIVTKRCSTPLAHHQGDACSPVAGARLSASRSTCDVDSRRRDGRGVAVLRASLDRRYQRPGRGVGRNQHRAHSPREVHHAPAFRDGEGDRGYRQAIRRVRTARLTHYAFSAKLSQRGEEEPGAASARSRRTAVPAYLSAQQTLPRPLPRPSSGRAGVRAPEARLRPCPASHSRFGACSPAR